MLYFTGVYKVYQAINLFEIKKKTVITSPGFTTHYLDSSNQLYLIQYNIKFYLTFT